MKLIALALATTAAAWEWGGVFELQENVPYSFTAGKVDGEYADPAMKMYMVELGEPGADYEALFEEQESIAAEMFESGDCPVLTPDMYWKGPGCVTLTFDQKLYTSVFGFEMFHDDAAHAGHDHGEKEDEGEGHADHDDAEHEGHEGHDHGAEGEERRLDEHDGHDHGGGHDGHDHGGHDPENPIGFAMFLEHSPYEFEADVHYLKDAMGNDVEPVLEEEGEHGHGGHGGGGEGGGGGRNKSRAWKNSMIASVLVLLVTATGAVLRLFMCDFASTDTFSIFAAAFAVGCLLATAFFLMFVESSHLIGARWSEESQMTWRFGTMALAGYVVGMISSALGDHFHERINNGKETGKPVTPDTDLQPEESHRKGTTDMEKQLSFHHKADEKEIDHGLVFTIFLGDFLHNFVDGIFIANAFLDCTQSKGWTIAGATIAHEIAQETSDFFLLITQGGLSQLQALIVNGLSGVSVIIGAAVFLWVDPGNGTRGLVLAFSGGTYVYIAATEAASVYTEKKLSLGMWAAILFLFCFGAVAIGLVLLDHEHCSGKGEDAHAGHNH